MDNTFAPEEMLYRGVFPEKLFSNKGGGISSAAFLTRKGEGASVDRQSDREQEEAIKYAAGHLRGAIVAVSVQDVYDCGGVPLYRPTKNPYHSEIHKDLQGGGISSSLRKKLAKRAQMVKTPDENDIDSQQNNLARFSSIG